LLVLDYLNEPTADVLGLLGLPDRQPHVMAIALGSKREIESVASGVNDEKSYGPLPSQIRPSVFGTNTRYVALSYSVRCSYFYLMAPVFSNS
jgi:hypothetical protein